ncbi:MAG: MFS transporter, partial [Henriciella sp.]|nr:MFS transporter [Henriciella sp.]
MDQSSRSTERQDTTFLYLYALAWAGGAIAYVPFLTVLLPVQVSAIAGEAAVDWLAYIAFVGAIFASLAHIAFGWLSDFARNRRVFVAIGLVLSCALLITAGTASSLRELLIVIALWQMGLNMMLAPLAAWAGDCVPNHQKGQLGGLLSVAPAVAAVSGTIVTLPGLADSQER